MGEIKPRSLDIGDTWIKIGCHRETHRLDRALATYQNALTLADDGGATAAFVSNIVSLYDHKGWLTVEWRNAQSGKDLHHFVNEAWADENEHMITHLTMTGEFIAGQEP